MAHFFNRQPEQMIHLTPWEHDALVAQTKAELDAIAAARRKR
jgi:hypothetical protein